jgi:Tol biopolymer transport system component
LECDVRYRCASFVTDRASGARHLLKTPLDAYEQNSGAISPDGRTVALLQPNGAGSTNVHLLDLVTGVDSVTGVRTSSDQTLGGRTFVWSPDSRWLFVTTGTGRVLAINRAGGAIGMDLRLGRIDQLALRTAPR